MDEGSFILNAARLHLSDENISCLKALAQKNIDWILIWEKACIHYVDTMIYYSLKNHNLLYLIPKDICSQFQESFYRNAIRNSAFLEGIETLSSIITDKIILLKGSYLIQYLYPNIAVRSMCDIDILLERKKAKENWDKLLDNGFHTNNINITHKSLAHTKYINCLTENASHLPSLYSDRFMAEVHWNLFGGDRFYDVTQIAWAKSHLIKENIYALSDEMMLIHLCTHFYKHLKHAAGLRMLCDMNELILKHSETIDWTEINEICTNQELRNEVVTALTYAHVLLKCPIPAMFIDEKFVTEKKITLDSLTEGNQKGIIWNYLTSIARLEQPLDRIEYVFRTFFPIRRWMDDTYAIKSGLELPGAYCKYWLYLFRRHILKQNIRYAD